MDVIIFGTGYRFNYPFLINGDSDNLINYMPEDPDHRSIEPLYKRMWCINEPCLIFAGLYEYRYHMYVVFERQAMVIAAFI